MAAKIDLTKYGITGTTEIVYNPSYEMLFEEETKPELDGCRSCIHQRSTIQCPWSSRLQR
jgi:ATP-dependent phosphoenolpyruvate carboxykinase